ncbi:MAG: DUF1593 domain-containing protein [Bacteroidetes bacterium]|nr:DUF1593 domain-containing protein [Bacteroidota bacterium]
MKQGAKLTIGKYWHIITIISILCILNYSAIAQEKVRPRIVVTADPELDDNNSLLRFLLYSTDVQVEGLIYTSSQFHWKGDGKGTKRLVPGREYTRFGLDICPCESWRWAPDERFIHDAVEAYEKVYPNLKIHNPDYPTPSDLKSKIRYGNVEFDGDFSTDTPGSDLIKSLVLDDKPGPLYITAWGGGSTIARALKSIEEEYEGKPEWASLKTKISKKIILLPSGDQDDTFANYIRPNWPEMANWQYKDGPKYGFAAQIGASPVDSVYYTADWLGKNILTQGPMGALYRVWGDGKQMVKGDIMDFFGPAGQYSLDELKKMGYIVWMPLQATGSWISEGDTPTFMGMLANGLRAYESAEYGGWGGYAQGEVMRFSVGDASNTDTTLQALTSAVLGSPQKSEEKTFPDFFPAAENDLATRFKWSVTPNFKDANHEPKVSIDGPLNLKVHVGVKVSLSGNVKDPDGDKVSVKWWQFRVGSYPNEVDLVDPNSTKAAFIVPADAKPGQTVHFVLEATDHGSPALTRYQRVIVTVE